MARQLIQSLSIFKNLSQFFYPALCCSCGVLVTTDAVLCALCMQLIKPVASVFLPITRNKSMKVFSVGAYDGPLRNLILKKFSGDMLAAKQLARLTQVFVPTHELAIDYIVAVPLHWTRYTMRGFNQAHEIAKELGRLLDRPVLRLLMRQKRTKFQSKLSATDRAYNVENAFTIHWWHQGKTSHLRGKNILLVDDLCTTGATLVSCAKTLSALNVASITALVGCRAV